jgi:hypothetical protein
MVLVGTFFLLGGGQMPITVNLAGASANTGISIPTLRVLIRTGKLPAKKVGKRIVVRIQDLERMITDAKPPAGARPAK